MKICIQTGNVVNDLGIEAGYKLLRECGFEGIDWNIDKALTSEMLQEGRVEGCIFGRPLQEILDFYREELQFIRENGLVISQAHAPFPAHIKGLPQVEEMVIPIYQSCIRFCQAIGCRHLVIHGISCCPEEPEMDFETVRKKNMRLYGAMIPVLQQCPEVVVCLENLFTGAGGRLYEGVCANPWEAVQYIDELNSMAGRECFGLCLDTGHLNLLRKNVREYIRIVGPRIQALHIHDNDGDGDWHRAPFTGSFRWNDFIGALQEIKYQGDLSFETFCQTDRRCMDPEYVPVFLRLIAGVGEVFRQKITVVQRR